MARTVNPNTVRPIDLQAGDVMVCTVTLHLLEPIGDEPFAYRMYVCSYPVLPDQEHEGVPQGTRIYGDQEAVARQLFPVVSRAGAVPDTY